MKTWEEILMIDRIPRNDNNELKNIIKLLKQAEIREECCINPPSENEICRILHDNFGRVGEQAREIIKRLRGEQ